MKWPWVRRQPEPQPGPEPVPEPQSELRPREFDLEEHIVATANVMAVRDAVNVFLSIISDHREDGHDCLPYCVPGQLAYFLRVMDEGDLRMMLTIVLKDMVDNYLQQQQVDPLGE
jgi:hypothetical protein